ncbi:phosphoenolpyruvate--protein phosphotransferase [Anaeromyxobacter paludicola]|uniref:Phosphoenolpyruvate-protein phosphotransferase n=1 Tax=Anaeromyxobacter paludicola TaxID=2918171 RepID=A0ABN6N8P9_9BACT|nr:phosphoenolpyruvate--protein phosphotransferase [Anaeromyxobacter paludicola]BDG09593.1 phosphoenolpyruvate-protein phosphotransferase [Anaeromyxobacter paludicola]
MPVGTTFIGLAASPGIAVGKAWPIDRRKLKTPRARLEPEQVPAEVARFKAAIEAADAQLAEVREKVARLEGSEHLAIIDMHRLMLKDEMLVAEAQRLIQSDRVNAEWAVRRAIRKIKASFSELADEYFKERRADIDYVGERIVKNLMGEGTEVEEPPPDGAIVISHDLSPADTALLLHERKVGAFVTDAGTATSHTAIVARALEVPAVVGTGRLASIVARGDWVVVDGSRGMVLLHPSAAERADYEEARQRLAEREKELLATRDLPAETHDGVRLQLVGNIEFAEEIPNLLAHGGEGVGLYRTEFLFLARQDLPDEEEHYQTYRRVLEAMAPRPVTIRTFDLGGDKLPVGTRVEAENPAMGLRGLRYCLRHLDIFKPQLRGLLRASVHGHLKIMFPMVSGAAEVRAAKRLVAELRDELRREGIETRLPPMGIMIEVPAAAQVADRLARECDFFSIGTNDLIQYTMAIDRQNKDVAYLYRPLHLSVLRTLRFVCDAARAAGIPVSMCGEMAGDPLYVLVLLGLGIHELSMNGPAIPLVKRVVRAASAGDGQALVAQILELTTAGEIEDVVKLEMARRFHGLLEGDAAIGPAGG